MLAAKLESTANEAWRAAGCGTCANVKQLEDHLVNDCLIHLIHLLRRRWHWRGSGLFMSPVSMKPCFYGIMFTYRSPC